MARQYSRKASAKVGRALRKRKVGTLKSGRSGRKVRSRKQAIAIGLSEARLRGYKVPLKKASKKKSAKKTVKKAVKKTAKKTVKRVKKAAKTVRAAKTRAAKAVRAAKTRAAKTVRRIAKKLT